MQLDDGDTCTQAVTFNHARQLQGDPITTHHTIMGLTGFGVSVEQRMLDGRRSTILRVNT